MRSFLIIGMTLLMLGGQAGLADTPTPKIADVQIKLDNPEQPGIYHIRVTIEHQDTGWEDYVDAWEIVDGNGEVLGTRPFFEPKLDDTKTVTALSGVVIPQEIKTVTIRARKHPQGYQGEPVQVTIPH